jgi:hypothetical protein
MSDDNTPTPAAAPAPQMIEVEIARDWWDHDEVRHPAGTKVSVPFEAALEGIETGALRRPKKDA